MPGFVTKEVEAGEGQSWTNANFGRFEKGEVRPSVYPRVYLNLMHAPCV